MIMISKDFFLSITRDFSDPYVRPTLHVGIGTGNPGVSQGYPYPYPRKPVPMFKGTGFTGYGYGFSPKITHLWNKNKIKNLYIKKQLKFSPYYGPNNASGIVWALFRLRACIGLRWLSLATVGFCGPVLAFIGHRWLLWAFMGLHWPLLTCVGLCWP